VPVGFDGRLRPAPQRGFPPETYCHSAWPTALASAGRFAAVAASVVAAFAAAAAVVVVVVSAVDAADFAVAVVAAAAARSILDP